MLTAHLPGILPHQAAVYHSPARFKLPVCGRRWGKTKYGLMASTDGHGPRPHTSDGKLDLSRPPLRRGALWGNDIWWVAPTYGVATMIWSEIKVALAPVWERKIESERCVITRPFEGRRGSLTIKSGEKPDLLRGAGLDGVVIDEAAFLEEEVWGTVLRPTLADRRGWAVMISTPHGRNWFFDLFNAAGRRPDWARWQRPTTDNPRIPPEEIEEMRQTMAPLQFRQEVMAEFISPEGGMIKQSWFRYYQRAGDSQAVLLGPPDKVVDLFGGGIRFGTVDLAASTKTAADYTVIASWLLTNDQELILLDLIRGKIEGPDQIPSMRQAVQRWRLGAIYIEATGYQLAMIQMALREGLPALELRADKDKVSRSFPLQSRMQAGTVYFPQDAPWLPELEGELLSFPPPPNKGHDDQVDACSYAAAIVAQGIPVRPTVTRA